MSVQCHQLFGISLQLLYQINAKKMKFGKFKAFIQIINNWIYFSITAAALAAFMANWPLLCASHFSNKRRCQSKM